MIFFVQRSELRTQLFPFLAGLVFLCSCATQKSNPPVLPVETSFNQGAGRGDQLFVTLHLENGEPLLFFVDTGSATTILDKSLASRLGQRLERKEMAFGWLGKTVVETYKSPKLYLGDTELLAGDQIWVTDFELNRLAEPGWPVVGILGMDCLRHYCVQLDFTADKMRFLDPDHLAIRGLGKAFPLSSSRFCITTTRASFMGERTLELGIDTAEFVDGSLQTDLLEQKLSRYKTQFDQWKSTRSAQRRPVNFADGSFDGGVYADLILTENPRGVDFIGLRFLARHLVTFNFPKRVMYLQKQSVGPLLDEKPTSVKSGNP